MSLPPAAFEIVHRLSPRLIADIGAADARDSIEYAAHFQRAQIHAFEPLQTNITAAQAQIPAHLKSRIHLHATALDNAEGETTFWRSTGKPSNRTAKHLLDENDDWRLSSSLLEPKDHRIVHPWCTFRAETVQTRRLDSFAIRPDYIHMDVQGAELRVLEGAGELLNTVRAIWLEVSTRELYAGQPLVADIAKWLTARDFICTFTVLDPAIAQGDQLWIR